MGKRGPKQKPEAEKMRELRANISLECEERLARLAPRQGRGRAKAGTPTKGAVICAALALLEAQNGVEGD